MDSGAVTFFTGFTVCIGFVVVLIELVVMCVASLFSRKERNMSFQKQIEAGAKLLDEKVPEWLEKQDLEKLDLSDPCNCVVGQSNPNVDYMKALANLFEVEEDIDMVYLFEMSDNHGFATDESRGYPELTEEWKSYIQERRTKQKSTIEQVP